MKKNLAKRSKARRNKVEHVKMTYNLFNQFVDGVFYPKIHNSFKTQEDRKEYIERMYDSLE